MARKNDFIEEIDKLLGVRIYYLRLAKGFSRQQLAKLIGVTHQQLQKYEKGNNKISIGRLVLIAKALDKNLAYFYEELCPSGNNNEALITNHQRMCIEVSRNFMKIESAEHQNAVNTLVKSLAKNKAA